MNTDGTLSKKEMRQVSKLNVYLRDKCDVPMKDSFRFAMLIMENWEGIKNIVEQEDRQND